jgi:hypothetical protein
LADYAALDYEQCIKCTIQYAPINEAEVWALEPEAKERIEISLLLSSKQYILDAKAMITIPIPT